jgi:hypothetical protein
MKYLLILLVSIVLIGCQPKPEPKKIEKAPITPEQKIVPPKEEIKKPELTPPKEEKPKEKQKPERKKLFPRKDASQDTN